MPIVKSSSKSRTQEFGRKRCLIVGTAAAMLCLGAPAASLAQDQTGKEDQVNDYFQLNAANIRRLQLRQEEAVQRCMKREGFKYQVQSAGGIGFTGDLPTDDPKRFAEQYGYGISTLLNPDELAKPAKDPNAATVAALSDAERKAWNRSLYGVDDPTKLTDAGPTKGCIAAATKELFSSFIQLTQVFSSYEELRTRVNNDKRVLEAMKAWSACMKQSGYSFTDDRKAADAINNELAKLFEVSGANGGATGGLAGIGNGIDPVKLRELQKREITQAKVDYACTTKHLKVRDDLLRVEEAKLVEKNRAVLEAARDTLQGKPPKPTTPTTKPTAKTTAKPTATTKKLVASQPATTKKS